MLFKVFKQPLNESKTILKLMKLILF